ncbi:interleukin-1 beta-like [Acipenser oxyrinchus oxyrinchus]|uniref:Interleukin-1 n=1 Tax=Acipenser oxyrinchus oxyrinchus TaxID=40147 RepID=A0AAD8CPE1_ACIOX|nr:interleukin-1 beta-like [Acipenser oxyrinchus oxyrinchus]
MEGHGVLDSGAYRESGQLILGHNASPHSICDVCNKYWVLIGLDRYRPELTAMMLHPLNISQQVTLLISTYIPQSNPGSGQLVVLGIKGTNYFLSCSGQSNSPVLKLETVVEPAKSLKTISQSSDAARFLFYKRDSNITSSFESFLFPGWFISNDRNKERMRVAMCNGTKDPRRVTEFYLSRITNSVMTPDACPV